MTPAPRYTGLRDYVRVLREQRWVVLFVLLVFCGLSVAYSARQDPVYSSETSLSFRSENEDLGDLGAAVPASQTPEQRAAVAAQSIRTIEIAREAAERLPREFRTDAGALLGAVTAQPEARTNLVVLQARAGDAERAAAYANAYAEATVDAVTKDVRDTYEDRAAALRRETRDLDRVREAGIRSINRNRILVLETLSQFAEPVGVVRRAAAPATPDSPRPVRNLVLGALLGLTLGLLVAFVRDSLDRRFKSAHELKEELHLPLVGHVRDEVLGRTLGSQNGRGTLTQEEMEAFRILRTNLDFLDVDNPPSSIAVTSALPEEGKSTVSAALACAYASGGRRVLLVEADLRRPTLAKRLGLEQGPGLTDFLAGKAGPRDVVQSVTIEAPVAGTALEGDGPLTASLVCITAGTPSPQPAELLGSERFKSFLAQVEEVYDVVVLDTSPLLSVVDTLSLVPSVDAVVLCVRSSKTTREQARAAKAALDHFPPRPMGIVVTGVKSGDEQDYGYYSYAYAYGAKV